MGEEQVAVHIMARKLKKSLRLSCFRKNILALLARDEISWANEYKLKIIKYQLDTHLCEPASTR